MSGASWVHRSFTGHVFIERALCASHWARPCDTMEPSIGCGSCFQGTAV